MATYVRLLSPVLAVCNCISKRGFSCSPSVLRLKSEWRRDRKPANTKLSDENVVERRKAFGGGEKWKAVAIGVAKYTLKSLDIEKNCKILDVVHNDAGPQYRENKIMALGTYVLIDGSLLKDAITVDQILIKEDSPSLPNDVSSHVRDMFDAGKIYAKITSRPGQVGNCDGVIVEGAELNTLHEKLKIYDTGKDL